LLETVNLHSHSQTCTKGDVGAERCRLCMARHERVEGSGPTQFEITKAGEVELIDPIVEHRAQPPSYSKTDVFGFPDSRYIAWECGRPAFASKVDVDNPENVQLPQATNGNLTEASLPLSACLNCNTCSSHLGNRIQCTSILFYLVKYMNKVCKVI
jgi:hypothetical protein